MLSQTDRAIMEEFAARVREHYPEARIWVFGSRARGDATSESDYDVCVVVPNADRQADQLITHLAWEVSFEHSVVIVAFCYGHTAFTEGPMSVSPLVRNVLSEGVRV